MTETLGAEWLTEIRDKRKTTVGPRWARQEAPAPTNLNEVQVGKDQEKAQSEKDSHSKTEMGKN